MKTIHHPPAEKNLKHKTWVLSSEEISEERCDMNFRPPEFETLKLAADEAYMRLLPAAFVGVVVVLVLSACVGPYILQGSNWSEAFTVGLVMALVAVSGSFRLLPRSLVPQRSVWLIALSLVIVIGLYFLASASHRCDPFAIGAFGLYLLGLPANLLLADQMTAQMIHWQSADPGADRNTMVAWRNAWAGRFMTDDMQQLTSRGLEGGQQQRLTQYWRQQATIVAIYTIAMVCSLLGVVVNRTCNPGLVMVSASLLLLMIEAWRIVLRDRQSARLFRKSLGHWFDYVKTALHPPWMHSNPAGDDFGRASLAYTSVIFLAVSSTFLGLAGRGRELSALEHGSETLMTTFLAIVVAALAAPAQTLLISFVVSSPAVSVGEAVFTFPENEE